MKKNSFFITLLTVVSLLVFVFPAAPVSAETNPAREPVGQRIGLFSSETMDFPANAPFNIRHGWMQNSSDGAIGIFDFQLDVDGVPQPGAIKMFTDDSTNPDILSRIILFNFPNGMTGTHSFTGHWYAPCQYAVDWLGYTGACSTPNQKVETNSRSRTINFVP